jgi:hypothetical protein
MPLTPQQWYELTFLHSSITKNFPSTEAYLSWYFQNWTNQVSEVIRRIADQTERETALKELRTMRIQLIQVGRVLKVSKGEAWQICVNPDEPPDLAIKVFPRWLNTLPLVAFPPFSERLCGSLNIDREQCLRGIAAFKALVSEGHN